MLRNLLAGAVLAVGIGSAHALMPLAKPQAFPDFDPGRSAPFADVWAITTPTMEVGKADSVLASCKRPVRIQAADKTHIFYLNPRETGTIEAMELQKRDGGALWVAADDGPDFFAFWVSHDIFYLYDKVPQNDADWGFPYVYRRCLSGEY